MRETYHFGPRRIGDYLKRFHQVSVATSTVHRILSRHGLQRLPANQKRRSPASHWIRYEKPQPGHRLQREVKFLERIPGTSQRLYQFTAIDDCTRIRILKVFDACNQRTAIPFIDEVLRRLPFRVLAMQTDNGAEFQSQFHWHVEGLDIRHVYIRPRTPHLNGKVERSHRVEEEEFYQLLDTDGITDDIHLSTRSGASGRTITITIGRTGPWTDRHPTNGWSPKHEPECYRSPETLHCDWVNGDWGIEILPHQSPVLASDAPHHSLPSETLPTAAKAGT